MSIIDVSRYQSSLTVSDFLAAKGAGVTGAFIRVTTGTNGISPTAENDIKNARAAQMPWGGYHWFTPDDPAKQASFFLSTVHIFGGFATSDLGAALDWEAPGTEDLADNALVWLRAVATGRKRVPWPYYNESWAAAHADERFAGYLQWIAAYGASELHLPPWMPAYHLWQRFDHATVPGIGTGDVDLSEWNPHVTQEQVIAASFDLGRIGL